MAKRYHCAAFCTECAWHAVSSHRRCWVSVCVPSAFEIALCMVDESLLCYTLKDPNCFSTCIAVIFSLSLFLCFSFILALRRLLFAFCFHILVLRLFFAFFFSFFWFLLHWYISLFSLALLHIFFIYLKNNIHAGLFWLLNKYIVEIQKYHLRKP